MKWTVITPPATLPLTYATAKATLRLDDDTEQTLVQALISTATDTAQLETATSLITQTIQATYERFEASHLVNFIGYYHAYYPLRLPQGPVSAITSVTDGQSNTIDPSKYNLTRMGNEDYCYFLIDPTYWPITITYTAGYGDASAVPNDILQTMLAHIVTMFENRQLYDGQDTLVSNAYRKRRVGGYAG